MLYLVIPTINGEIIGSATIYSDLLKLIEDINYESIIYKIDIINQLSIETDICELIKQIKKRD